MVLGQVWEYALLHSDVSPLAVLKTCLQLASCILLAWAIHAFILVGLRVVLVNKAGGHLSRSLARAVGMPWGRQLLWLGGVIGLCVTLILVDRMVYAQYLTRAIIVQNEILGKDRAEIIRLLGRPKCESATTLCYKYFRPQIDSSSFIMSGVHSETIVIEFGPTGTAVKRCVIPERGYGEFPSQQLTNEMTR
jgi:hypothetical protein